MKIGSLIYYIFVPRYTKFTHYFILPISSSIMYSNCHQGPVDCKFFMSKQKQVYLVYLIYVANSATNFTSTWQNYKISNKSSKKFMTVCIYSALRSTKLKSCCTSKGALPNNFKQYQPLLYFRRYCFTPVSKTIGGEGVKWKQNIYQSIPSYLLYSLVSLFSICLSFCVQYRISMEAEK